MKMTVIAADNVGMKRSCAAEDSTGAPQCHSIFKQKWCTQHTSCDSDGCNGGGPDSFDGVAVNTTVDDNLDKSLDQLGEAWKGLVDEWDNLTERASDWWDEFKVHIYWTLGVVGVIIVVIIVFCCYKKGKKNREERTGI